MPLKAVLFDMDGVIVDTEPLHRKAYFNTFKDLNIAVSEEFYTSLTGTSTKKSTQMIKDEFNLDVLPEEIAASKRKYFKHYFDTDPEFDLLPGVRELIVHYFENGIKLVLASSASMNTINWVFEKFDLEKYFMGKISGADLEESKPNPEIFIKASQIADESRESCMVIEDSTNGIIASHRANIFCAAYKSEHSKLQKYDLANIVVSDFSDLEISKIQQYFI
ncbi:HAD family hydrolase [Cloacibacterium sp.]|jgi:beta-phosphoglucomutase-like phosphatase (HAD superfamily)|uniref:HAD family hydrolase n=1 Tax=Cloacibacterium sp. TaxID=1913682 RepID=UPI0039E5B8A7